MDSKTTLTNEELSLLEGAIWNYLTQHAHEGKWYFNKLDEESLRALLVKLGRMYE